MRLIGIQLHSYAFKKFPPSLRMYLDGNQDGLNFDAVSYKPSTVYFDNYSVNGMELSLEISLD